MNNNDQQFNDNNFDENTQPMQSQNDSENSYEYVFSNGSINPIEPTQTTKRNKDHKSKAFLQMVTIVLCMILAFGSGFAGAICANYLEDNGLQTQSGNEDTLHQENPESILDKDPSSPSNFGSAGEDVFAVSQVANIVLDTVVVVKTSSVFDENGSLATAGSGVLITDSGYIVTCHHVIEGAKKIVVSLNSGEEYEAALVGSDEASDIALLLIDAQKTLPFAGLGNSSDLILGESVVAIGNPLGELHRTVTSGVISGLNRNIKTSDGTVMTLLQTDAAVNSGNSGGGLFNLDGELIGIVNAKYAQTGVEGLAFAIPIDWAYEIQLELLEYGYVRGVADNGLSVLEINSSNLFGAYVSLGIGTPGVYVVESEYCEELQYLDRILSINGTEITTEAELNAVCKKCKVGDTVEIIYSRKGTTHTTTLTFQEYIPDHIKNKQE